MVGTVVAAQSLVADVSQFPDWAIVAVLAVALAFVAAYLYLRDDSAIAVDFGKGERRYQKLLRALFSFLLRALGAGDYRTPLQSFREAATAALDPKNGRFAYVRATLERFGEDPPDALVIEVPGPFLEAAGDNQLPLAVALKGVLESRYLSESGARGVATVDAPPSGALRDETGPQLLAADAAPTWTDPVGGKAQMRAITEALDLSALSSIAQWSAFRFAHDWGEDYVRASGSGRDYSGQVQSLLKTRRWRRIEQGPLLHLLCGRLRDVLNVIGFLEHEKFTKRLKLIDLATDIYWEPVRLNWFDRVLSSVFPYRLVVKTAHPEVIKDYFEKYRLDAWLGVGVRVSREEPDRIPPPPRRRSRIAQNFQCRQPPSQTGVGTVNACVRLSSVDMPNASAQTYVLTAGHLVRESCSSLVYSRGPFDAILPGLVDTVPDISLLARTTPCYGSVRGKACFNIAGASAASSRQLMPLKALSRDELTKLDGPDALTLYLYNGVEHRPRLRRVRGLLQSLPLGRSTRGGERITLGKTHHTYLFLRVDARARYRHFAREGDSGSVVSCWDPVARAERGVGIFIGQTASGTAIVIPFFIIEQYLKDLCRYWSIVGEKTNDLRQREQSVYTLVDTKLKAGGVPQGNVAVEFFFL